MASTNKHVTNDSFARVTWTDLAMGKGPSAKVEGDKSKSSQRSLSISQAVANFSLANQKKELMEQDYEEIKSEDEEEPEEIEDKDAPKTYRANFNRRNTVLRQQILSSDDNLNSLGKRDSAHDDSISDRPKSATDGAAHIGRSDEDTDAVIDYDEQDDQLMFGNFKFRSFKTHKLIEEDYDLLNIEDPEDVTNISASTLFPEDKVIKEAVEVVPVTKEDLMAEQKEQEI